jgi:hypothetical protein
MRLCIEQNERQCSIIEQCYREVGGVCHIKIPDEIEQRTWRAEGFNTSLIMSILSQKIKKQDKSNGTVILRINDARNIE